MTARSSLKGVGLVRTGESKPSSSHKWARSTASFCDLVIFEVVTPVQYCELTVTLMDQDTLTGHKEIYAPKVIPLEILAASAASATQAERVPVAHNVVFDRRGDPCTILHMDLRDAL